MACDLSKGMHLKIWKQGEIWGFFRKVTLAGWVSKETGHYDSLRFRNPLGVARDPKGLTTIIKRQEIQVPLVQVFLLPW